MAEQAEIGGVEGAGKPRKQKTDYSSAMRARTASSSPGSCKTASNAKTFPIGKISWAWRVGATMDITEAAILDVYDHFTAPSKISVHVPKGGGNLLNPDASQYVTPLDLPPGDVRAAHLAE